MALMLTAPVMAEESGIPRLEEHQFVPVLALDEPFMTTHLQMGVALGWTLNATQPIYSLDPSDSVQVGEVPSDQFLTGIAARYQQRVKDWLVARIELDVAGRLGTDTSSLLNDGITGAMSYGVGWMMRAYRSESVLVSGSVSLTSANATFVNLSDYVEDLLAGEEDAQLVRPRASLSGIGGAHAAWGINRRFGLLGALKVGYGESFDGRGANEWFVDVRAAVSYDTREDLSIPIGLGLTGAYSQLNFTSETDEGTWFWNLRIAGQGRADFSAGVELQNTYIVVTDQPDRVQFFEVRIDMRYFY
jgi:hypothetical protein